MADNLSSLISDAFTIYSEAYRKIGQIGVRVVELDKAPSQPRRWNELVYATRLFRNISPSITLNGGGTAIIGVVGDIQTINNLLLKLKRAVKLYDVPVFPTPLTEFVINLGSGGADADATYITVITEGGLPQSRRLSQGAGISLTDNGAQGTYEVGNTAALTSLQFDSSINPVLNLNSLIERLFYGSVAITGLRTWSLSNTTNARRLQAIFSISGLTPGDSTHNQTLWANTVIYTSAGITPSSGVFQPLENREYEIDATTYDGVNWRVNIF
jgi:hypothetical protein